MLCRRAAPAAPRTVAAPRPSAVAHRLAGRAARPSAHVSAPRLRRFYATDRNVSDTQAPFDDASLQRVRDPFEGISQQPFPKEVAERLMQRIPPEDIEIRPDGLIYLPEIKYRRVLNTAIGPGGWALMPRAGTVAREEASYSREFALFCFGRFVAQARGEQGIGERGFPLNLGFLDEAAKSNALMRCCKDIGVASELWDPAFITEWKAKHAVDVWVEHVKTGEKRKLWRRKDRGPIGYPYKEVNLTGGNAPANVEAPPVVTADTFTPGPSPALGGHSGGHGPGRPRQRKETDGGAPATAPSPAASSGEFDMSAPVPSALKKVAGKTWADVVGTEDGRRYLSWVTSPDAKLPAQLKTAARKALDLHSALSAWETPDKDPAKNE